MGLTAVGPRPDGDRVSATRRPPVTVRDYDPRADRPWADDVVEAGFGSPMQVRRGEVIDVLALPGLVAEREGSRVALLTYRADDGAGEAELALLATPIRGAGGGTALVRALRERITDGRIWVVTTNDNVDALRFYQRLGFRLRAARVGAIDEARRTLKPSIPVTSDDGIPIRDELELVLEPD